MNAESPEFALFRRALYQYGLAEKRAEEVERGSYSGGFADGKADVWLQVAEFLATRYPELSERLERWEAGRE